MTAVATGVILMRGERRLVGRSPLSQLVGLAWWFARLMGM